MHSIAQPRIEPIVESSTIGLACVIGFYFSFRVFLVLVSVRLLGTDPQAGVEVSLALNFALLIVAAFFSLGEVRYPLARMAQQPSVRWVFLFLGFSGFSLLW